MQRGVINLTMPEIEMLKDFAASHEQLKSTKMLQKILDWQPTEVTQNAYDLELTLEDAETVIDTLQSVLHDAQAEQTKIQALADKFKQFYSDKTASNNHPS